MADEITKFLAKLPRQQAIGLLKLMNAIKAGIVDDRDVKKLSGSKDIFRIRKGKFRVIYKKNDTSCAILSVSKRSEKTYRDF